MTGRLRVGISVGALASALAAITFQPLNIKPGLWEITLTVRTAGAPPMPPELLPRLTPEQRALMEARTKSDRRAQTTVKQSCLKAEELEQPLMLGFGDPQNCRQTLVEATAARQEIKVQCGKGLAMGGGTIKIEAANPENVKVTSEWSGTDSSRTATMSSTATLKWLGADCVAKPVEVQPPPPQAPSTRDAGTYYKLGREQATQGDFAAALRSLDRAIELDPHSALAHNARGYAHLRLRDFAAAIEDFSEAIRLRPDYLNAYQNRAAARRRAGDARGAAEDEHKAAELAK